jgi:hypothetical protein
LHAPQACQGADDQSVAQRAYLQCGQPRATRLETCRMKARHFPDKTIKNQQVNSFCNLILPMICRKKITPETE